MYNFLLAVTLQSCMCCTWNIPEPDCLLARNNFFLGLNFQIEIKTLGVYKRNHF